MKQTVIDIGSNSVRLMAYEDGVTLYKKISVTRLSHNMENNCLDKTSLLNTAKAVQDYYDYSLNVENVKPLVFGTEALRIAQNKEDFLSLLPCSVDIISGETEAKIGYLGAKDGFDKTNLVIDIGGASTELVVGNQDNILFAKSCPIGVVRILNRCKEDEGKTLSYIKETLQSCKQVPIFNRAIVIGGTGLNLVSATNGIIPYDPKKVHQAKMTKKQLEDFISMLKVTAALQRERLGIHEKRCDIILGGARLLYGIMEHLLISEVVASESDNLEGYLKLYEKQS